MDTTRLRHSRVWRWSGRALLAGVAASLLWGFGSKGLTPSHRTRIAREAPERPIAKVGLTCPGGQDYPATIQLLPDAVVTVGGRESVEYHAEINVLRGTKVGLAWSGDVINDRGQTLASKLANGTATAKAGGTSVTNAILSQPLADGFYQVRVRVAVSPENEPATILEASQPVKVANGKWLELTAEEWRDASAAKLAFAVTGPIGKGVR